MEVGGNIIAEKVGNILLRIGNNLIERGKPFHITNPNAKLINPFALLVNFTVNVTDKYQIILQGDYKQRYRECDGNLEMAEEEMFEIIRTSRKIWFKKE